MGGHDADNAILVANSSSPIRIPSPEPDMKEGIDDQEGILRLLGSFADLRLVDDSLLVIRVSEGYPRCAKLTSRIPVILQRRKAL